MEALPLIDLQKICRICLKSTELLVSIFSTGFVVRPVDMIAKLQIFKYNPDDGLPLPTSICQACIFRLLDAYNLKELSESSEVRLRDYLNSTGQIQIGLFLKSSSSCTVPEADSERINIEDETTLPPPPPLADSDLSSPPQKSIEMYQICDIFEANNSNDIEVGDDVLNDVEIDVSNLTRSENDETIQDIIGLKNDALLAEQDVESFQVESPSQKRATQSEKCDRCGKVFATVGYLETHMRTHTGEKPFKCEICHKSFAQSSNLTLHKRVHTGQRQYQCEICSKFFSRSSNLSAHKLTHLETREFDCRQCSKAFKSQRELTNHQQIHSEVKQNVCNICQKDFAKAAYLAAHTKAVHSGVKNYKCEECGKAFSNRSNLVCHIRIHTGEKPFKCNRCEMKFNQSSALIRHYKQHDKNALCS